MTFRISSSHKKYTIRCLQTPFTRISCRRHSIITFNTKHIRAITIIFIVSVQCPINSYICVHTHLRAFGRITKDEINYLFLSSEFFPTYHFKHTNFFFTFFRRFPVELENSIAFSFLKPRCSRAHR